MNTGWVFTVGDTLLYKRYFKEISNLKKAVGGSVFLTREIAEKHKGKDQSVFLVRARWEIDTKSNLDFGDLLVEARIYNIT